MSRELPTTVLAAAVALLAAWVHGDWAAVEGLGAVLEVVTDRVLDGDPRGALEALAAV